MSFCIVSTKNLNFIQFIIFKKNKNAPKGTVPFEAFFNYKYDNQYLEIHNPFLEYLLRKFHQFYYLLFGNTIL